VRLSLTILLLLFGLVAKSNLSSCPTYGSGEFVKVISEKKGRVAITTKSIETQEVKKGGENTAVHILNSILKVSFASKNTRHFLDGFFISYFSYFTSYISFTAHNDYPSDIAIAKKLTIVYPFHSFW
jgi:hypothetical protein